jgi:hypothetical protein
MGSTLEIGTEAMRKRVYLETTIPSFYHTRRTDVVSIARMRWTRQWWDEIAPTFILTTSAAVIAELRRGVGEEAGQRVELLRGALLLSIPTEVERIAQGITGWRCCLPGTARIWRM